MGAGASTVARLRKTLIIRSYNLRKRNETADEQFRPYAMRKEDRQLYISIQDILRCLDMLSSEYEWVEKSLRQSLDGEVRMNAICFFLAQH